MIGVTTRNDGRSPSESQICYMEFIAMDKYIFPKWVVTVRTTEVKMFILFLQ